MTASSAANTTVYDVTTQVSWDSEASGKSTRRSENAMFTTVVSRTARKVAPDATNSASFEAADASGEPCGACSPADAATSARPAPGDCGEAVVMRGPFVNGSTALDPQVKLNDRACI